MKVEEEWVDVDSSVVPAGRVRISRTGRHDIHATFNNTIVTMTDQQGNAIRGRAQGLPASRALARARPTPRRFRAARRRDGDGTRHARSGRVREGPRPWP